MGDFPREVVVSPGWGAGLATWNTDGYRLAEDPELIACVRERVVTSKYGPEVEEQTAEVERRLRATGRWPKEQYPYICLLGMGQAEVVEVYGPYRIDEYDGNETLIEMTQEEWRT